MYVRVDTDGNIVGYSGSYRELAPNVSFPENTDEAVLAKLWIYPVISKLDHDTTTHVLKSVAPYKANGQFYDVEIVELTSDEVEQKTKAEALRYLQSTDYKMSRVVEELADGNVSQNALDLVAARKAARAKL